MRIEGSQKIKKEYHVNMKQFTGNNSFYYSSNFLEANDSSFPGEKKHLYVFSDSKGSLEAYFNSYYATNDISFFFNISQLLNSSQFQRSEFCSDTISLSNLDFAFPHLVVRAGFNTGILYRDFKAVQLGMESLLEEPGQKGIFLPYLGYDKDLL